MRLVLLGGFDRSGSSMIGGLLGKHPGVAYFFQPFNRTEVHAQQYAVWRPEQRFPRTERFLAELLQGRVERDYLGADLFKMHSTAAQPDPSRLNVIKDTKVHFKLEWLRAHFPEIELGGIWREPLAILHSLKRNGFAQTWYGEGAFEALRSAIEGAPELADYRPFLMRELTDDERMAVVIAARTHLLCTTLAADAWIAYEEVVVDCDGVLNRWAIAHGLARFPFGAHQDEDFNVSGKPTEGADAWRRHFAGEELERLKEIFAVLDPVRPRFARSTAA